MILGTTPISQAPYRKAPTELSELETLFHVLLGKGFIRRNISPYGSLVFYKDENISLWNPSMVYKDNLRCLYIVYRLLNKFTVGNKYLFPRIKDLFD